MKKYILSLLVLIPLLSLSQTFVPLNSKWYTKAFFYSNPAPGTQVSNYYDWYATVIGDTIAGTDTIQKIKYEKYYHDSYGYNSYFEYFRYMYYDSSKVYYGNHVDSLYVLYDFNLNVGDEVSRLIGIGNNLIVDTVTVISIDTVQYGGVNRKRISFSDFYHPGPNWSSPGMVWVEGIGDVKYGLVCKPYISSTDIYHINYWSLACFREGSTMLIGNCPDDLSTEENIEDSENEVFKLYPNPANNELNINCKENEGANFKLYDVNSKLVGQWSLNMGLNQLNIEHLNAGIYFGHMQSNQQTWTEKLIVR